MAWSDAARAAAAEARRRHKASLVPVDGRKGIGRRAYSKILRGVRAHVGKASNATMKMKNNYVRAAAKQIGWQSRAGQTSVLTRSIKSMGGWKGRV